MTEQSQSGQFEIRGATRDDFDGVFELSRHLNSVNLPHRKSAVTELLERSENSFSGKTAGFSERRYMFVLVDLRSQRIAGTSMIIAQLGRRGVPYIFLDVGVEERYSSTLDRHVKHQVLRMGYSYDGPTELGGLVMHPDYRRSSLRFGRAMSYVRFLFIAMHRERFQNDLLAELMPPLRADGTSHLWEAVGSRFVDLSYQEADKLSKTNKEFIWGLFPTGKIYTALLAKEARDVIGEVGPDTRGVEKMLRRVGFEYVSRVDPFDGGPHFMAATDSVSAVLDSRPRVLKAAAGAAADAGLLARVHPDRPWFEARICPIDKGAKSGFAVAPELIDELELEAGASYWTLPF